MAFLVMVADACVVTVRINKKNTRNEKNIKIVLEKMRKIVRLEEWINFYMKTSMSENFL